MLVCICVAQLVTHFLQVQPEQNLDKPLELASKVRIAASVGAVSKSGC